MAKNNTLAIITHILGWLTYFIGPLIILLASEDKTVKKHAKVVLNWQFSLIIYGIVSAILVLLLVGILFIFALGIMNIVFSIIGAVRASEGKVWRYPLSINFFKV